MQPGIWCGRHDYGHTIRMLVSVDRVTHILKVDILDEPTAEWCRDHPFSERIIRRAVDRFMNMPITANLLDRIRYEIQSDLREGWPHETFLIEVAHDGVVRNF